MIQHHRLLDDVEENENCNVSLELIDNGCDDAKRAISRSGEVEQEEVSSVKIVTNKYSLWKLTAYVSLSLVVLMALVVPEKSSSIIDRRDLLSEKTTVGTSTQVSKEALQQLHSPVERKKNAAKWQQGHVEQKPIQANQNQNNNNNSNNNNNNSGNHGVDDNGNGNNGIQTGTVDVQQKVVVQPAPQPLRQDTPGRHLYRTRGKPMKDQKRANMIKKWGSWTLVDEKERPKDDYYQEYPNRDVPRSEFPSNAWQTDTDYLSKFLPEGLALVQRAQNAILEEYGYLKGKGNFEDKVRKLFWVEQIPEIEFVNATGLSAKGKRGKNIGRPSSNLGGWTTAQSWEGLRRRLLHAVMTEDSFVFAMGGHSAAAGHGNHFQQSYTLQVQWILEAVFARLGVKHEARNFGNGGLGTLHNGVAAASMYGPDVDMLMWDSSMTAGPDDAAVAARQQLMAGTKVPVIWTFQAGVAKDLHDHFDADIGYVGTGNSGITMGTSLEEIEQMPWAMQYVRCSGELFGICRSNEYKGTCWIDREDFTPLTEQKAAPGGRAKWHPGNRKHQVTGRILAFTILQALKEALEEWNTAENYVLDDSAWHVTERYNHVRNKLLVNEDKFYGNCNFTKHDMQFICNTPMKGRTEFTPRAYPSISNLRELMRPEMLAKINDPPKTVYMPPDIYNPELHPPDGATDVLNIVEAGVDFRDVLKPDYTSGYYKRPTFANPPKVPIGKGIQLDTQPGDEWCDGSVDSWCKRGNSTGCLLYGHNDGRNGLLFHSYSGWIVLNLPDVKNGIISVKVETWHNDGAMWKTVGWTSVNNEGSLQRHLSLPSNTTMTDSSQGRRELGKKKKQPALPCESEFYFEYAVDGDISRYNETEINQKKSHIQRVVEVMPILNNPKYTNGEEKEVEIAIRLVGCGTQKVWKLNHVYWS